MVKINRSKERLWCMPQTCCWIDFETWGIVGGENQKTQSSKKCCLCHGCARSSGTIRIPPLQAQSSNTQIFRVLTCDYASYRALPGIAPASEIPTSVAMKGIKTIKRHSSPPPRFPRPDPFNEVSLTRTNGACHVPKD